MRPALVAMLSLLTVHCRAANDRDIRRDEAAIVQASDDGAPVRRFAPRRESDDRRGRYGCAGNSTEVGLAQPDAVEILGSHRRGVTRYSTPEISYFWAFNARWIAWVAEPKDGSRRVIRLGSRTSGAWRELAPVREEGDVVATYTGLLVREDEIFFTGLLRSSLRPRAPIWSAWSPVHTLYRVSANGGPPEPLADTYLATTMLAGSGDVFFAVSNAFEMPRGVSRLDARSGVEDRLAYYGGAWWSHPRPPREGVAFLLTATDREVFWVLREGGPRGTDTILRTSVGGGAIEDVRTAPAQHVHGLEAIDGRAYYARDDAVRRVDDDVVVVRTGDTKAHRFARAADGWIWCDDERGLFGRELSR